LSRCCRESACAQQEWRSESAAHSTHGWRTNVGQWWARNKCARVGRRAWCAAVSVGQRLKTSQTRPVSLSCNHCSTCGKEFFSALVTRWVPRTVAPTRRWRGATRGAVGGERGARVAGCEAAGDLQRGLGGVVCGPAGGQCGTGRGQGERLDGTAPAAIIVAQRGDQGPVMQRKTYRHGLAVAPRTQALAPRVDRCGPVREPQKRSSLSASGVEAAIVCGGSPVEAKKGGTCCGGLWLPVGAPCIWDRGVKGQACGRSAQAV
jgi:hypothetical protein